MGAYANFSIAKICIHLQHVEHGKIPLEYTTYRYAMRINTEMPSNGKIVL